MSISLKLSLWIAVPCLLAAQDVTVSVQQGVLRGQLQQGVRTFLGVPFATPPIGDLRFRAPEPSRPWTGVRTATALPPACPQRDDDGKFLGSEDCLYLNVWSREGAVNAPVMFFIHGGGNVQGFTANPLYDGSRIAREEDVVVVTVQYRLGALGYLVHPALDEPAGNYGLRDLVLALHWVRDNIGVFGGDARRVMVFGESAGGVNTCMLVASPAAAGLFSRALMQSGACRAEAKSGAMERGTNFASGLSCSSAECLRGLSAEAIVGAQGGDPVDGNGTVTLSFGPSVDGYVLPAAPLDLIQAGQHNRVPFAIGANADETAVFTLPLTEAAYRATVVRALGPVIGALVLREYPVTAYDSPRQALIAVTTDSQFVCPSRAIARAVANAQEEPVYRYFFTHSSPAQAVPAAFHGLELAYLFQRFSEGAAGSDLAVQRAIREYWTNFAATGDPNASGLVRWPEYVPAADSYLEISAPPQAGRGVRTEKCDFWERMRNVATP
ncbi:MAG: carboxylesterase family protein [Bryobacterales bacterium]|nr:carboxylesterase family protein [Bryobacterales bacterium]